MEENKTTLVYSFGARAPIEGADLADDQFHLAHRYRNQLVEIERRRRTCIQTYRDRFLPRALLEKEAELNQKRFEAVGLVHQKRSGKGRKADVTNESAYLKTLRAELSEVRAKLKEARATIRSDVRLKSRLHRIDQAARNTVKAARAASGLYWGTYLQIEDAVEQAKNAPMVPPKEGKKPRFWHEQPAFVSWSGNGKLAVQLQHGLSLADAFACTDTRLQIELVHRDEWFSERGRKYFNKALQAVPGSHRSQKLKHAFVRFRAGSHPNRTPIFIEVPVLFSRPIPEGARIKWAWLLRTCVGAPESRLIPIADVKNPKALLKYKTVEFEGAQFIRIPPKYDYTFQLVVEEPAPEKKTTGNRVALDIGWRRMGSDYTGLRVGYWAGSDGRSGEVLMPAALRNDMEHVEGLRSQRDDNRDVAIAWLQGFIGRTGDLPLWFTQATSNVAQWRGGRSFRWLLNEWTRRRFEGDAEAYDYLRAWDKQDRHLWEWEAERRHRILRNRREVYRVLAAGLATEYAELVIGDFDLRKVATEVPVEKGPRSDGRDGRRNRFLGAPHELRSVMVQAFERRGGHVVKVSDVKKTQTCHACGHDDVWDASLSLLHTCRGCGKIWDQDDNHARNLLASAEAVHFGGEQDATDVPEMGRRARMRRKIRIEEAPAASNQN